MTFAVVPLFLCTLCVGTAQTLLRTPSPLHAVWGFLQHRGAKGWSWAACAWGQLKASLYKSLLQWLCTVSDTDPVVREGSSVAETPQRPPCLVIYPSLCLSPACIYELWEKVVTAGPQISEEWVMCKKLCLVSCWRLLVFKIPKKPCLHRLLSVLCIPKVWSYLQTGMLNHLSLPAAPCFLLGLVGQ